MHWRDYVDAARGRKPRGGSDGSCITRAGQAVDLELFKFDT